MSSPSVFEGVIVVGIPCIAWLIWLLDAKLARIADLLEKQNNLLARQRLDRVA
jgi:hypothetical protein